MLRCSTQTVRPNYRPLSTTGLVALRNNSACRGTDLRLLAHRTPDLTTRRVTPFLRTTNSLYNVTLLRSPFRRGFATASNTPQTPKKRGRPPKTASSASSSPVAKATTKQPTENATITKAASKKSSSSSNSSVNKRERKEVVLLDNSYLVLRTYMIRQKFASKKGFVADGYVRSLIKIIDNLKPDYMVACNDSGTKDGWRRKDYEEYKIHRPPVNARLRDEWPIVNETLDALGIRTARVATMEADDVIAAYTKAAVNAGCSVVIVTKDKDLAQLAGPHVRLYDPQLRKFMDEDGVKNKMGVAPPQLGLFLALQGDKSDNVPGVKGCGPVMAARLAKKYATLPNLLKHLNELDPEEKTLIESQKDKLVLSYKLVTLQDGIPLPFPLEDSRYRSIDTPEMHSIATKYGFKYLPLKSAWRIEEPIEATTPPIRQPAVAEEASLMDSLMDGYEAVKADSKNYYLLHDSTISSEPTKKRNTPTKKQIQQQPQQQQQQPFTPQAPSSGTPLTRREHLANISVPGVTIVDSLEKAKQVVDKLLSPGIRERYHACDTEVINLDIKKESPYRHGRIICFSIYVGPDVDFGSGPSLWVDTLDEEADEIMNEFKRYFEDSAIKKVWHNYSFDRAEFHNHGIVVEGFGGDTLHMARLWDSSRMHYSLESLTSDLLATDSHKHTINDLFSEPMLRKDGTPGKKLYVPPLEDIQRGLKGSQKLLQWIKYSALDAESTWLLRERLQSELQMTEWCPAPLLVKPGEDAKSKTLWDYYKAYWAPFGALLTDMEMEGIKVNVQHLAENEVVAKKEVVQCEQTFRKWASQLENVKQAAYIMNVGSDAQKRQLFFAPGSNKKTGEALPATRKFSTENTQGYIEEGKDKAKKTVEFEISGLGIAPVNHTDSGWPGVDANSLQVLAGQPNAKTPKYGTAFAHFRDQPLGSVEKGRDACLAIDALVTSDRVSTLLTNFMIPLQHQVDESSRVHASLNLNTETGRLSCRKPNLQNQPALEKDRYKIRQAFGCEPGNSLIVADYGQLELRVLAHMAKCESMIDAFKKGGDFHSRTAMGMYPEVSKAVERGDVLLEWDYSVSPTPPRPLLKDEFAAQRRKAKTLNFSIAYGKTAVGLAADWQVTRTEAAETLERWYSDRPEVKEWQRETKAKAHENLYTTTLIGRRRNLPEIRSSNRGLVGHAERAAINTPIQGGAADIVVHAMIKVHDDPVLREWGWKLILQVHDELILEGPSESQDQALARVKELMAHPFDQPLAVDLIVDGNIGKNWFEAK